MTAKKCSARMKKMLAAEPINFADFITERHLLTSEGHVMTQNAMKALLYNNSKTARRNAKDIRERLKADVVQMQANDLYEVNSIAGKLIDQCINDREVAYINNVRDQIADQILKEHKNIMNIFKIYPTSLKQREYSAQLTRVNYGFAAFPFIFNNELIRLNAPE